MLFIGTYNDQEDFHYICCDENNVHDDDEDDGDEEQGNWLEMEEGRPSRYSSECHRSFWFIWTNIPPSNGGDVIARAPNLTWAAASMQEWCLIAARRRNHCHCIV